MAQQILLDNEIIVDSFCGGGGASEGIRMATGRDPDVAINHDPEAIAMHQANHPTTKHYCKSIYRVDPEDVVRDFQRPIGLAWFSPDCTHHSKARGGKPKEKHIRDLAWVVVHWAERAVYQGKRPRLIYVENVEEFQDWGPLLEDGKPCPVQKGFEFRRWVKALRKLGYKVEWRELRACDFGAPTIRKRLFVIARCDGQPIVWPKPTHGKEGTGLATFRTAAECIDWSIPCPSIFLTKEEGREIRAKRPLADATLRRVAHGIKRFVLDAKEPFIVRTAHGDIDKNGKRRGKGQHPIGDPLGGVKASRDFAVVQPFLSSLYTSKTASDSRCHDPMEHVPTIMTDPRHAVIVPYLTEHANASSPRVFPADSPLRTQCAQIKGGHFALCAPSLIQVGYGERDGQKPRILDLGKPIGTMVGSRKHAVTAAFISRHFGTSIGSDAGEPVGAATGKNKTAVSACFLAQHNSMPDGGVHPGRDMADPFSTLTASGSHQNVIASSIVKLRGTCKDGQTTDTPLATISAQGQHLAHTAAFLTKYYGNEKDGEPLQQPMGTSTGRDRFGYVETEMHPEPLPEWQRDRARAVADLLRLHGLWDDREFVTLEINGASWVIVDIGMRMLSRRELFNAQGFRRDYIIDPVFNGRPMTNTASVRMCGNSVSPPPAAAIIRANPVITTRRVKKEAVAA